MLKYSRIVTILVICAIYAVHDSVNMIWGKWFVGLSACIYIVNHIVFIKMCEKRKLQFFVLLVNGIISALFGFLFPGSTLYLILFGIDAVVLFTNVHRREVIVFFLSFFFLCWFSILLHTYQYTREVDIWSNLVNFMFVVFCALAGELIKKLMVARQTVAEQYEELTLSHDALQEAHEQLRHYAKEVEELTAVRERNDIAREIHDTVGHNMTALLVQLQLAEALWQERSNQTEQTLQTCTELARKSLQDVRTSVRTLKEESEGNIIERMRTMLHEFSKVTNVQVTFQLQGDPAIIPLSLQPTIFRILQESLTNAKRHGKATVCNVSLLCLEEKVTVSISDDGIGTSEVSPGFGLMNMKERVEEHGGAIHFESEKGTGFQLLVQFPIREKKWVIGGIK